MENDCIVCTTYFGKLLRSMGIEDFEHFAFTPEEELMIEYGRAIAKDPKQIPDELFERLRAVFNEESATIYTMVEMARSHKLNIEKYLTFLLTQRPQTGMSDEELEKLVPWSDEARAFCGYA